MLDPIDTLEAQAEELLSELAAEIDKGAQPSPAVIGRVKACVTHQLNEQWLAGQPAPAPSTAALQRVRAAVHRELASSGSASAARLPWSHRPWLGSLAAAAMIALAAGLIHHVGSLQPRDADAISSPPLQMAEAQVNLFIEAAQVAMAGDSFSESVLNELREIDARLAGSAQGSTGQSVLDQLDGAMKELLDTPEASDRTMGNLSQLRALG